MRKSREKFMNEIRDFHEKIVNAHCREFMID